MRLEDSSEAAPGCNSAYGCVASKARNRDISFTPGFSPVSNDDKRRETVLTVFTYLTHLWYRLNGSHDLRSDHSPSCGAAIRVKPRVRLCEPWVMVSQI